MSGVKNCVEVLLAVNPMASMNTYFPAEPGEWSSLGPVWAVLKVGGPTSIVRPVVDDLLQQLGHVPGWLKAGATQLLLSKFSDQGALTALHAVVKDIGPTHGENEVGPHESRT